MVEVHHSIITYQSPVGNLQILCSDDALIKLSFSTLYAEQMGTPASAIFIKTVVTQLGEYFSGKRKDFTIRLAPQGTEFRKTVWKALQKIPFGQTCSYQDIANAIQNPKSVRAVGTSNGANPIAIIIPCHRVIGNDGKLTGYGGGIEKKKFLLDLESSTKQLSMF